jgi:hypothetical protein
MLTRLVFTLTLFGAAFLSFSIQPILGKMLLPFVGGAPAGWIVAMAFFQLALLGGYALSYVLQRVSPVQHGLALLLLYGAGLCTLPAQIDPHLATLQPISLAVMALLAKTILLPFIALTATTSALLRIFSHTDQPTAQDPYYLFTASNAGSLIGLFVYPLVLEPMIGLHDLNGIWLILYCVLSVCMIVCLVAAYRQRVLPSLSGPSLSPSTRVPAKTLLYWFCLAFVPCSLSMSITTFISTDMGSFPLVWTLPLGLYLLSFILGFARRPVMALDKLHILHIVSAFVIFVFLVTHVRAYDLNITSLIYNSAILLSLFFVICWSCHQTLAATRPSTRHLTLYYLLIAAGGAMAGFVNAFLCPMVLKSVIEFPISVILSFCLPMIWNKNIVSQRFTYQTVVLSLLLILCGFILYASFRTQSVTSADIKHYKTLLTYIFVLCACLILAYPRMMIALFIMMTLFYDASGAYGQLVTRDRNFFGSFTVAERYSSQVIIRTLRHGNTTHGTALYNMHGQPTYNLNVSYYAANGPLKDVYNAVQPQQVAVMGLGAGQLACFPSTAKTTFFEIDPNIVTVAKTQFPYLQKCPPDQIVMGDARVMFSQQTQRYDLLILDVFSSDGIPIHILTRDAIAMYRRHLSPSGVMLFHTSNRYLSLAPQIAASAQSLGLNAYKVFHIPTGKNNYAAMSQWVAIPLSDTVGQGLLRAGWATVTPGRTTAWTDDRSSLLTALTSLNPDTP